MELKAELNGKPAIVECVPRGSCRLSAPIDSEDCDTMTIEELFGKTIKEDAQRMVDEMRAEIGRNYLKRKAEE